jgi:hypothetical protein
LEKLPARLCCSIVYIDLGGGSPMNPKRGISKSQKSDGFGTNPTFAWDFFGTFGFSLLEEGGIQRQDFFKK